MVAAVGLPGIGVSWACGSGNDVFVVVMMRITAKAGFARLVDVTTASKCASMALILIVNAYKRMKFYLALLRGYLVDDKGELDKL
jgi:hypothetical protein